MAALSVEGAALKAGEGQALFLGSEEKESYQGLSRPFRNSITASLPVLRWVKN